MKTLIIVFILSTFSAYSQNGDTPALPINWNDTTTFITKQNDFYIGYHWMGSTPKIVSSLLHCNHFFEQWGLPGKRPYLNNIPHDGKVKALVWSQIGGGGQDGINEYMLAIGIDPTAPIHSLPAWNVVDADMRPRTDDTTRAFFGFA